VVAKRKGSGGGGWVALGFPEESQGMKGMDVALLRRRYGSETGIAVDKDTAATNPSSSAFVLEDRFLARLHRACSRQGAKQDAHASNRIQSVKILALCRPGHVLRLLHAYFSLS
jgi:hypothetical protein